MVKQLDIFGNEVDIETAYSETDNPLEAPKPKGRSKYKAMIELHGELQDKKCGDCEYFLRSEYNRKMYFKCEKWILSNSAATDKRVKDQACNLFKEAKS